MGVNQRLARNRFFFNLINSYFNTKPNRNISHFQGQKYSPQLPLQLIKSFFFLSRCRRKGYSRQLTLTFTFGSFNSESTFQISALKLLCFQRYSQKTSQAPHFDHFFGHNFRTNRLILLIFSI